MIVRHGEAAAFRARVTPRLVAREAENNLVLGLLGQAGADALLLEIDDDAVALRTPPWNLVISALAPAQIAALLAWLDAEGVALPGVVGPSAAAAPLAAAWSARHATPVARHHALRAFENRALVPPRPPLDGGALRVAGEADVPLVLAWIEAFNKDVDSRVVPSRALSERRVRDGDFVLWQTADAVVAMAAIARRTPHGAAVAYVYTPPALRGRGYASAVVAGLTARLHAAGLTAFLFTDVANPTSNKIYQALGYVPVASIDEWKFG